MEMIVKRCAGLDVHKKSVTACVRALDEAGAVRQSVRTFGTMTRQLLELADWLTASILEQPAAPNSKLTTSGYPTWAAPPRPGQVFAGNLIFVDRGKERVVDVYVYAGGQAIGLRHGLLAPPLRGHGRGSASAHEGFYHRDRRAVIRASKDVGAGISQHRRS